MRAHQKAKRIVSPRTMMRRHSDNSKGLSRGTRVMCDCRRITPALRRSYAMTTPTTTFLRDYETRSYDTCRSRHFCSSRTEKPTERTPRAPCHERSLAICDSAIALRRRRALARAASAPSRLPRALRIAGPVWPSIGAAHSHVSMSPTIVLHVFCSFIIRPSASGRFPCRSIGDNDF